MLITLRGDIVTGDNELEISPFNSLEFFSQFLKQAALAAAREQYGLYKAFLSLF